MRLGGRSRLLLPQNGAIFLSRRHDGTTSLREHTDNNNGNANGRSESMPKRLLEPIVPPTDLSPVQVKVSYRWFSGTLLNGIVGIALMGGALYAAIDGQRDFAVEPALELAADNPGASTSRKSDRRSGTQSQAVRSVIHESKTRIVGAKEFIYVDRYARVAAQLELAGSEATASLPPFDPLKLFSEAAAAEEQNLPLADAPASHGIVNVNLTDMVGAMPAVDTVQLVSNAQASSMVREALELSGRISAYDARPAGIIEASLGTGEEITDDFESWDIGTTIEEPGFSNLTTIEKEADDVPSENMSDRVIIVQSGDSISSMLTANGATTQEIRAIAGAMNGVYPLATLRSGQQIRIRYSRKTDARDFEPERVSLFSDDSHEVTVVRNEDGGFEAANIELALLTSTDGEAPAALRERTSLYISLHETGVRQSIPAEIIDQVIRNHSYDVDFKRNVQAGDTLEVFYSMADELDPDSTPELLFSSLTVRGETRRFYRFRTPDDGRVDFYDQEGHSAKKFLIRIPVNGAVLRSQFGMRMHPILRYRKMHTGVDFTVGRGTPIVAAGNGVVEMAKRLSGYGRYTVIRHANGYKTAYAHQQGFAEGIVPGAKVRQGQVIGYVGSSGLSTGPHLHYEVIVNGNFVDPMRIRVPRGRSLQSRTLAAFNRERNRINRLMQQPPASTRVASADSAN